MTKTRAVAKCRIEFVRRLQLRPCCMVFFWGVVCIRDGWNLVFVYSSAL